VAALAALCLGGAWAWQSPRRLERQRPVQRRHLVRKRSFIQPGRAAARPAHLLCVCHTRWASFAVRIIVVDAGLAEAEAFNASRRHDLNLGVPP
jgi:hypothetical protein